ncbi:MAG TPA: hypothetical protein VFI31_15615 [Pirellulales bacterium]|nr:hypothetical protein [Pirellulales bacterium]
MTHCLLFLAMGMDDWLKLIGLVVFALIYGFNYLLGALGKGQQRRPPRPEQRGPRPAGRPAAQDEVAEFLKRASEKRPPKPAEARPRRVATAEIIEAHEVEEVRSSGLSKSLQAHVDNRELKQRAAHLTHVEQAETAFQAHLHDLDHSVGRIHEVADTAPLAPGELPPPTGITPAQEILSSLLADPQNLKQAILLNEIIQRPVERW